ncbi:MAG: histidine phosphatase family protein [Granulosicoccaceae bacterium]
MASAPNLDIIFLRHGPTPWNLNKRLQGHTDIPLDWDAVRRQWPEPRLAGHCYRRRWFCSPLLRARQTAEYFGLEATPEPALIEMAWGQWEGRTLASLRADDPEGVSLAEAAGLDLRAPGGESPREVQARLGAWAEQLMLDRTSVVRVGAIAHKGVIRAVLAAATGWDMLGKAPVKLDFKQAIRFCWRDGMWEYVPEQ